MKMTREESGSVRGVVAVLIFLAVVTAGGFGAYWKFIKHPADILAAAQANKPVKKIPDPTADWTEFTDPSGLFTVKLPLRWHYVPASGSALAKIQPNIIVDPKSSPGISQIAISDTSLAPIDYYESKGLELANYTFGGDEKPINGYKAYTAFGKNEMPSYEVATIVNKGKVVQFMYYVGGSFNRELPDTKRMINTIKFTN
jgi:hypothetical protein